MPMYIDRLQGGVVFENYQYNRANSFWGDLTYNKNPDDFRIIRIFYKLISTKKIHNFVNQCLNNIF